MFSFCYCYRSFSPCYFDIHFFLAPLIAHLLLATLIAHLFFVVMAIYLLLVAFVTCFFFVVVAICFLLVTPIVLAPCFCLLLLGVFFFLSLTIESMENLEDMGKEVVYHTKKPLEMDSCGFAIVYGAIISITLVENNSNAYAMVYWDLLAKQ